MAFGPCAVQARMRASLMRIYHNAPVTLDLPRPRRPGAVWHALMRTHDE